jgi:hypothetical protein
MQPFNCMYFRGPPAATSVCSGKCFGAIDQDGDVIDILVQPRRDQLAAERFFRKLLMNLEVSHKPSQPHSNDAKLTIPNTTNVV